MTTLVEQTGLQRFRAETRRVLRLALPLVVGQFAMMGMGVTDVIVAGHAGTNDLAAVTIGFYAWDLCMLLVFGTVLANSALVGHQFGAGNIDGVRRQFQQCMWVALPLSLFSGVAIYAAMLGVGLLDLEPEVAQIAADYLFPTIGTAMLVPFAVTFRTTSEGVGLTRPVMWLTLGAFVLNIPLDYALVHGAFGIPALGGEGCGWASLIAFLLLVAGWILYTLLSPALRRYRLWQNFGAPIRRDVMAIFSLGLPIGLSLLGVGGFFAVLPLMMSHLGAVAIAGHSVAITVDTLMLTIPLGVGQAMAVRVAHELGGGEPRRARQACITGMSLLAGIALMQAGLIVALREPIIALFTRDPAVKELAVLLLLFAAAYRLFDSVQIGAGMALRGYKDTRVASALNIAAYWVFGLPLCYGLGLGSPWNEPLGVPGFWAGMVISIALAATLIALRLKRTARRALGLYGLQPAATPTAMVNA
jgi:multidrug resistance protein, MATE family